MGALFLSLQSDQFNLENVEKTFKSKKFFNYKSFILGSWILRIWEKQKIKVQNYYDDGNQGSIFASGSPCYKGRSYKESLIHILEDMRTHSFDYTELQGSCVIILFYDSKIRILTDELNIGTMFIDKKNKRFSTSFLSLIVASDVPWQINRLALKEKVATGYIVGPDTLISGILKSTDDLQNDYRLEDLEFISHSEKNVSTELLSNSFNQAVEEQVLYLKDSIQRLASFSKNFLPELGLSSGYDSRLLLAICLDWKRPLGIHTHSTLGSHEKEQRIAEELCRVSQCKMKTVPTRQMQEQSAQRFEEILEDSLLYYDGRNSAEMGAFSETYTREYRSKIVEDYSLGLSGLGGEIYRNYFVTSLPVIPFHEWMIRHVYYPNTQIAIPEANDMYGYVSKKMSKILKCDLSGWVDQLCLRSRLP